MVRRVAPYDACPRSYETVQQKGKDPSPIVTRFVKVMIGKDHTEVLHLPPKFARKVDHLAGQATEIEDSGGAKWSVTVSNIKGSLALQKGWNKFYRDHGLEIGDFVVFNYIKGSHFVVQIYSSGSACERTKFNNEKKRASKRLRQDPKTVPQEEPCQTTTLNSRRKPDVEEQIPQTPMNNEDLTCMVNRDGGNYRREDRDFLFDLSNFEMKKETLDVVQGSPIIIAPCPVDVQMDDVDEVLPINIAPCPVGVQMDAEIGTFEKDLLDTTKETEMDLIHVNQNVDNLVDNFEKGSEEELALCRAEITMGYAQINVNSDDVFTDKFQTKPSDESNLSKNAIDNIISSFRNGKNNVLRSHTESPSIGSSKIAERESAVKHGYASLIAKSKPKDPFGKCAIKEDLAEVIKKASRFLESHGDAGKETSAAPPVVKVEPETLDDVYDAEPSVGNCYFSAEVKSLKFLELPVQIPSTSGRRYRGRGKFVRLRDPMGRLWAILNPAIYSVKALTGNWTNFCQENGIKPGDECRFRAEKDKLCTYRVDIVRK